MKSIRLTGLYLAMVLLLGVAMTSHAEENRMPGSSLLSQPASPSLTADSISKNTLEPSLIETATYRNVWGLDILISNDGFGLGTFFRREFSESWYGFASFSISESKDEREIDQYNYITGTTFVPQKLNRFLVFPLLFGVQHRLFKDDITETFRPYVNAGLGPTMIFASPYVEFVPTIDGGIAPQQIEFFKGLGKGRPHYTAAGYIGFGANFGVDKSNIFGVNFRYYFTYLFGGGLPSLYDPSSPSHVAATKKDFGGFFITLNVGMAY